MASEPGHPSGQAYDRWFLLGDKRNELLDAYSRRHFLERAETHDSIAIDHERGRKRDSAFLSAVEQSIRLHCFARDVAQERKSEAKFLASRLRPPGIID